MISCGPIHLSRLCRYRSNSLNAKLIFHSINLFKCGLKCIVVNQCLWINACLLKNISIICDTISFYCIWETNNFTRCLVFVSKICILCKLRITQISNHICPVCVVAIATNNKNVWHIVGSFITLNLPLNIHTTTEGFNGNFLTSLLLKQLSNFFQLLVNLNLSVNQAKSCRACRLIIRLIIRLSRCACVCT